MRRVGDDHRCASASLHGALRDHFLIELTAMTLHMRVPFHRLVFLLDLIFAHHQLLGVELSLPDEVCKR